jgi:diguanylate cyclase (GGDEF)-like protein
MWTRPSPPPGPSETEVSTALARAAAFDAELRRRTVRSGRVGGVVVFLTTPGWALVDRMYVPESEWSPFLTVRILVSALVAVAWLMVLRREVRPGLEVVAVFAALGALVVQTAWMLPRAGDAAAVYLLALITVLFGSASMVDWHWRWNAWLVGLAAVSIAGFDLAGSQPLSGDERILAATTIVTAGLLSVYGQFSRYRRSWGEFQARLEAESQREANEHLVRKFEDLSRRDPLTQVPNRRAFDEALEREIARSARSGDTFGLLLVDVDWFKRVNDTFGHQVGDVVLQTVAAALTSRARVSDVVARYGGEEFVILLPGVLPAVLADVADLMRERVKEATAEAAAVGQGVAVTISAGAALFPASGATTAELIAAADAALYQAKADGRDRTVVAPDRDPTADTRPVGGPTRAER